MKRTVSIWICISVLGVFCGCQETIQDGEIYRLNPDAATMAMTEGFAVPNASEVDLVENMAAHRSAYKAGLEQLRAYYSRIGDVSRQAWAAKELDGMEPWYRYLMPAEMAPASLRAGDSIAAANVLYREGLRYFKEAGDLRVVTRDDAKLRMALARFNDVIENYPSSDKIDDCAYRAAQIYEHFRDYEVAVIYYQRTYQWDEDTRYPARYMAAKLLDKKLKMRDEALILYRLAVEKDSRYADKAKKRIAELVKVEPIE